MRFSAKSLVPRIIIYAITAAVSRAAFATVKNENGTQTTAAVSKRTSTVNRLFFSFFARMLPHAPL